MKFRYLSLFQNFRIFYILLTKYIYVIYIFIISYKFFALDLRFKILENSSKYN